MKSVNQEYFENNEIDAMPSEKRKAILLDVIEQLDSGKIRVVEIIKENDAYKNIEKTVKKVSDKSANKNSNKHMSENLNTSKRYIVNVWIKKAILAYFKYIEAKEFDFGGITCYDKFDFKGSDGTFRLLPGAIIRKGSFVAPKSIVMPPSFINVGAYIDEGTMIDSNALIGSCAQIGKRCHISAGTMIGGVLEPSGAMPVIVEDDVFIGGNCGIYEGVLVKSGAIIGTGTIINASTPVIDMETGHAYYREVPENAVVIPGGKKKKIGDTEYIIQVPLIVKWRKNLSDPAKVELNELLR